MKAMYRSPDIFKAFPNLVAVESTRHGGLSEAPYASLNLGLHTEDEAVNVRENRRRFFSALQIPLAQVASSYQVHGDQILEVTQAGAYEGYDALMTDQMDLFLTVTVADCTPVLIYDARQKVVAAIHAGWRGTVAGIVTKVLHTMQKKYDCRAVDCRAYVGTCIDECSFEVDADVADHFADGYKRWDQKREKFLVDLKKANTQQLVRSGLPMSQIAVSPFSTVIDNDTYFSYRKEGGRTGRMLAVIGMKK